MRERPILFSAPMVRAILAGTKTVTRRIVTSEHVDDAAIWAQCADKPGTWESGIASGAPGSFGHGEYVRCPYGVPGDRLWVRETHARFSVGEGMDRPVPECVAYRATCDGDYFDYVNGRGEVMNLKVTKWTPSIFMPRWASRITLDVVSVRVERLHAITEDDAKLEGVEPFRHPSGAHSYRDAFAILWDDINGDRVPFDESPWVWRVEFKPATPHREGE